MGKYVPTGRASTFTKEKGEEICLKIIEGLSVRKICEEPGMPNQSTVYDWLLRDEIFAEQYARAREIQADNIFEEILEISDDSAQDTFVDAEGNRKTDHEVVSRSRLRVDARKWMAGKLAPKKYSDKLISEISGPDGGPIQSESKLDISSLTEEQLRAISNIRIDS